MLTLENDQLTFSFPSIGHEIHNLACASLDQLLHQALADRRQGAWASLKRHPAFESCTKAERQQAKAALLEADPAGLATSLKDVTLWNDRVRNALNPELSVEFERTLRIPDDGQTYPLPAGIGTFPLRPVDDFAATVPPTWLERGGVLLPMYQAEALWIYFSGWAGPPCAMQVAAGMINAISSEPWGDGLCADPQNYAPLPNQPWLDGFAVEKGIIRQFVAAALGTGATVEEQLTGAARHGGLQLRAYPLRARYWFEQEFAAEMPRELDRVMGRFVPPAAIQRHDDQRRARLAEQSQNYFSRTSPQSADNLICSSAPDMGMAAGGKMRQEIYRDPRPLEHYDQEAGVRCFVHLCNAMRWREITGTLPPHPPLTANEYRRHGLPWFDHYRSDLEALAGGEGFAGVKSLSQWEQQQVSQSSEKSDTWRSQPGFDPAPDLFDDMTVIQSGDARRPVEIRQGSPD